MSRAPGLVASEHASARPPSPDPQLDVAAARRALEHLRQLERELEEQRQIRRLDALDRARDAVRRIGEVGSPEGVLDRAAEELGASSGFERVLISQVRDGLLVAHTMWVQDDDDAATAILAELSCAHVRLGYPLVEHEVARHQRGAIVELDAGGSRSPRPLAEALSWTTYVVVPLTLRGATVGMLHADAATSGRAVDALDLEVATLYAEGLASAFERAALRSALRRHREELGTAVRWMSVRLEESAADADTATTDDRSAADDAAPFDALTAREGEVIRLLVRGHSNRAIAKTLVVSEGTVKYHVKNVLRKLHATNRAEAVARWLRTTGGAAR